MNATEPLAGEQFEVLWTRLKALSPEAAGMGVALAAHRLRDFALAEFDRHGPQDPRGAALWDAASYLLNKAAEVQYYRGADVVPAPEGDELAGLRGPMTPNWADDVDRLARHPKPEDDSSERDRRLARIKSLGWVERDWLVAALSGYVGTTAPHVLDRLIVKAEEHGRAGPPAFWRWLWRLGRP